MTLEQLLSFENPSQEQVIAEIGEGFYSELFSLRGPLKAKALRIITDEVIRSTSEQLKADLSRDFQILSLEDVQKANLSRGMTSIFGFERNVDLLKKKLVERGVFSLNLKKYSSDVVEKVCEKILNNRSKKGIASSYFSTNVDNGVLSSNRYLFANSEVFKEYLNTLGIYSLDDVNRFHASRSLGSIMGFKNGNSAAFKQKLAELGVFSLNLKDYDAEVIEKICTNIVDNFSNHVMSSYFSKDLDESVLLSNRSYFVKSEAFQNYFKKKGIDSLDDIKGSDASAGLGSILGFKHDNSACFKKRLVELNFFSLDLRDYSDEVIEKICQNIIDNLSNAYFISIYFSQDLDEKSLQSNKAYLVKSEAFRNYLKNKGIFSLYDIKTSHASHGLGSVLGFKQGQSFEFRQRLIELEVFTSSNGCRDEFFEGYGTQGYNLNIEASGQSNIDQIMDYAMSVLFAASERKDLEKKMKVEMSLGKWPSIPKLNVGFIQLYTPGMKIDPEDYVLQGSLLLLENLTTLRIITKEEAIQRFSNYVIHETKFQISVEYARQVVLAFKSLENNTSEEVSA